MATQPSSRGSIRFTHLQLGNWRNFTNVNVDLQKRGFLVGPNASGKSNFLDVFGFLHEIVSVGGGFREAVRQRGGVSQLRSLAARQNPEISIKVSIGTDEQLEKWEYELRFTQDNQQRPTVKREIVKSNNKVILNRPNAADREDPILLTQTYLEQVNANKNFRDVADFFSSVRYLHIVPQLIREPDRSIGRFEDPYGGDFLEQLTRTNERTRKSRLKRIREALTIAVPQLIDLELKRDNRGTPHLRGKYEHWRPQGAWQDENLFSDGTLRLFGLLWSMLDGSGPLLLEEPELQLHPEVVRYLPQMFARIQRGRQGRQVLLSTHSPDLLHDEGIGADEILLLEPRSEGTSVRILSEFREAVHLLQSGIPMDETVIPRTRPKNVQQLAMFDT